MSTPAQTQHVMFMSPDCFGCLLIPAVLSPRSVPVREPPLPNHHGNQTPCYFSAGSSARTRLLREPNCAGWGAGRGRSRMGRGENRGRDKSKILWLKLYQRNFYISVNVVQVFLHYSLLCSCSLHGSQAESGRNLT